LLWGRAMGACCGGVLWVGPTARGSSFEAVSKRADREWKVDFVNRQWAKTANTGSAKPKVATLRVMRPRPMAGNVRKREIVADDFGAIAKLLAHGFTRSTPLDWMGILDSCRGIPPKAR
jgi:hypothetical protein